MTTERPDTDGWTRRGFGSLLAAVLSAGCLRTSTDPATSTETRSDTATATAPDSATATAEPTGTPTGLGQVWTVEPPGSTSVVRAGPENDSIVLGGRHGVSAVSPTDGTVEWTADTGPVFALPAISTSTVYAPGDDGTLYALSRSDGAISWTFEADTGLTTVPLAATAHDRVVVGAGESDGHTVGSVGNSEFDPTYLHVLDADGTERWSVETANGDPLSATAIHGDRLYLRTHNRVEAHSLSDGGRAWRVGPHDVQWDDISHTPYRAKRMFADGDGVYVPTQDGVTALGPDGTRRWRFEPFDSPRRYQHEPGTLYVAAEDNVVYALDTADGSQRWRTQRDGTVDVLVRDGATLWTGTDGATLGQVRPDDGTELFSHGVDDAVQAGDALGANQFVCLAGRTLTQFETRHD